MMTDKVLDVASYGIVLTSENVLKKYLKNNKIRTKKVLKLFKENHSLYLDSISKGVWIPFLQINSIEYVIKLSNNGENFDENWEKKIEEDGFNLAVEDCFWVLGAGVLYDLGKENFDKKYMSYQTLDGETLYNGFRFDLLTGNYLVKIEGYRRKIEKEYPNANYGFLFTLTKVDDFKGYKDSRENEKYYFNVAQI
ncbi:hypothetical protein [Acinetobacter guillouiae]|uniref:hypothetical protein n=1 Tax=Acinetobacter guillouiae TaxID=106649 RepID=UPI003AF5308B